jgi:hypothetical protein
MNENRNAPHFDDETRPRGCERGAELVTYLYSEATPGEARLFRQHLGVCAVCREELAAFGGVREAVGEWSAEALGSLPSLNINEMLAPVAEIRQTQELHQAPQNSLTPQTPARKRSAVAALREFFSLSPLWLRAGALAATLIVCALAALTLARAEVRWNADGLAFRTGVTETVVVERVQAPTRNGYTEEQVNAIVAQRVAEAKAQSTEQQPEKVINVSEGGSKSSSQPNGSTNGSNSQRRKRTTRPNTRRDEPLLAEDNLPRLSDLLSGSY